MTTVTMKSPRIATLAHAPILGTHLPMFRDRMADTTANQMNAIANTYFQTPSRGSTNEVNAANAVIVRLPPSQIGFESQLGTWLRAATNLPNAILVHVYGAPSSVKADPSSAVSRPYGRKKKRAMKIIHVNPWAP